MVIFCNFTIYYLSFLALALHLSYSWCRWNQKIGKAFQKIGFGQLRGVKHRWVHVFAWAATKPSGATCHRYIRWRWQRRSWLQRYTYNGCFCYKSAWFHYLFYCALIQKGPESVPVILRLLPWNVTSFLCDMYCMSPWKIGQCGTLQKYSLALIIKTNHDQTWFAN